MVYYARLAGIRIRGNGSLITNPMISTTIPLAWALWPIGILLLLLTLAFVGICSQRHYIGELRSYEEHMKLERKRLIDSAEEDGRKHAETRSVLINLIAEVRMAQHDAGVRDSASEAMRLAAIEPASVHAIEKQIYESRRENV